MLNKFEWIGYLNFSIKLNKELLKSFKDEMDLIKIRAESTIYNLTPFCSVILPTKVKIANSLSSSENLKYFFCKVSFAFKWSLPHAS